MYRRNACDSTMSSSCSTHAGTQARRCKRVQPLSKDFRSPKAKAASSMLHTVALLLALHMPLVFCHGPVTDPTPSTSTVRTLQADSLDSAASDSPSQQQPDYAAYLTTPTVAAYDGEGDPTWYTGVYVLRTVTLTNGQDTVAHLIRTAADVNNKSELLEMDVSQVAEAIDLIVPGTDITVAAFRNGDTTILVQQVSQTARASPPDSSQDGGTVTAQLAAAAKPPLWTQLTTVTEMPILFIISGICGKDPVVTVDELYSAVFDGPGSKANTLEGFYRQCSQGLSYMNSSISKVVGPVTIPCSYSGPDYSFSAESCTYRDSEGWMRYASDQAVVGVAPGDRQWRVIDQAALFGVDLTRYRHRVLLMPRYYIYQAGCPWMGLGTLGPDNILSNGEYQYSSVWLTGELWKQPAAFFHELGHTNYLHHAATFGRCAYCDLSCTMGDCCDIRCLNPVHNWQMGWGTPLATLSSANMAVGAKITYVLPQQQSTTTNMILIIPDWLPGYNTKIRAFAVFIGYRVGTGKYDSGLPPDYVFATNVYWWDGQIQHMARYSYLAGSVGTQQELRNSTWGLSVKQLDCNTDNATVVLCHYDEVTEKSCYDGIDNDCDGLVDFQDPDCIPYAGGSNNAPDGIMNPRPPAPLAPPPGIPGEYSIPPDMPVSQSTQPPTAPPPDGPPSPPSPPSPKAPRPLPKWKKKPPRPPPKSPRPLPKWKLKPPRPPPPAPEPDTPPPPSPKPKWKWAKRPRPPKPPVKSWAWKMSHRPPPSPPPESPPPFWETRTSLEAPQSPATAQLDAASSNISPAVTDTAAHAAQVSNTLDTTVVSSLQSVEEERYQYDVAEQQGVSVGRTEGEVYEYGGEDCPPGETSSEPSQEYEYSEVTPPGEAALTGEVGGEGMVIGPPPPLVLPGPVAGSTGQAGGDRQQVDAAPPPPPADPVRRQLEQQARARLQEARARQLQSGSEAAGDSGSGGQSGTPGGNQYSEDIWDPEAVRGDRHLSASAGTGNSKGVDVQGAEGGAQGVRHQLTEQAGAVPAIPEAVKELFPDLSDSQIWRAIQDGVPPDSPPGTMPDQEYLERAASAWRFIHSTMVAAQNLLAHPVEVPAPRVLAQHEGETEAIDVAELAAMQTEGEAAQREEQDACMQEGLDSARDVRCGGMDEEGLHAESEEVQADRDSQPWEDPHREEALRFRFRLVRTQRRSATARP